MKLLFLIPGFVFVVSATTNTEWEQYKATYNKVYTTRQEDIARYNQYIKKKKSIEEHNIRFEKGETTYWKGINQFSDWFAEEINQMLGFKYNNTRFEGKPFQPPAGQPVPDAINWVEKGAVTKVKNQGVCHAYYAFAAAGNLEAVMFIANKTITDLSVQELVDCSSDIGCYGGCAALCLSHVQERNGIDSDASYPYKGNVGKCRADDAVPVATCNNLYRVEGDDSMKAAVGTVGPIINGFAVGPDFVDYKGGIFDGACSPVGVNYEILVVGYGTDKESGKDYWLLKNCWGESWGEKGYARVIRHVDKCFIEFWGNYATYEP